MTLTVALTPHLEAFIRQSITDGRYQSENDVVRSALRMLAAREHERAAQRDALLQGVRKGFGPGRPMTEQDWDELRRRAQERAGNHNGQ
jgi:antitoxin ParD1/3/4